MVAGFDIEFQAECLSGCDANSPVHSSRTYACAGEYDRPVLAGVSPPAPRRNACGSCWRSEVLQFGMPIVPTSAPNEVIAEAFPLFAEHIVCRQSVDIVGCVDGSHRTRKI